MGLRSPEQHALLTDYDQTTAYSQAFYTLFANIRFQQESEHRDRELEKPGGPPVHTLLVAGASPYKDQVIVAANLAIVSAQSGAETILVDADLHTPETGLRQRFGLGPSVGGLSDVLEAGEVTPARIGSVLQSTFVPGLRLFNAGSAAMQGTALLLSSRLAEVIASLRTLLQASERPSGMIVFHSASVLAGADASLVGALTEQTVLTVIMGQTTRTQGRQAQEQLQQARIKLAGVIMLHP